VILTAADPNAVRLELVVDVRSHCPPELVLAVAENEIDPPPVLDTVIGRLRAGPCWTNGKVNEPGFTLRLGCPAAVTVNATGIRMVGGVAFGVVMVTVAL
jgi:hypothetical protein